MKKHLSKYEIIAIHQKRLMQTAHHVADLLYDPLIDALQKYAEENQNICELRCEIPIASLISKDYVVPAELFDWAALCSTRVNHDLVITCIEEHIHARFPEWESVYVIKGDEAKHLRNRTLRFTDGCGIMSTCPRPEEFTSAYVKEMDRMLAFFMQTICSLMRKELGSTSGKTIIISRLGFPSCVTLDDGDTVAIFEKLQQQLKGHGWHIAEMIEPDAAVINSLDDRKRIKICTNRSYNFTLKPFES